MHIHLKSTEIEESLLDLDDDFYGSIDVDYMLTHIHDFVDRESGSQSKELD